MNFSREEWYGIYEDAKDYAPVFGVEMIWDEAENIVLIKSKNRGGSKRWRNHIRWWSYDSPQLEALLNALPIEIVFG